MVDDPKNSDDTDSDLVKLEARVNELISTVGQLTDENRSLRQQQETLVNERAHLIETTELARSRVEAMIARLKSLELGA
jgi:cell division protein ZapB